MTSLDWLNSFTEFNAISEALKNQYLIIASSLDTSKFTIPGAYAIALYAAHIMSTTATKKNAAGGGEISSIKEGGLSISYASGSTSQSSFSRSPYGRMLLEFLKQSASGFAMDVVI